MIDSQVIKLHAWMPDNVLLDLAHIVKVKDNMSQKEMLSAEFYLHIEDPAPVLHAVR